MRRKQRARRDEGRRDSEGHRDESHDEREHKEPKPLTTTDEVARLEGEGGLPSPSRPDRPRGQ